MLQGIVTVVCLVGFIAIFIWAYSSKQKPRFEAAAKLPLEDDLLIPPASKRREP